MSAERNKEVVREFFERGNRGDVEGCLGLFADEVTWEDIGSTRFSGVYRGKPAVVEDLIGPLFSLLKAGIHSDVQHLVAEGERVVALSQGRAETVEGVPYDNRYCHVFELADGRIVSVLEFMDTALVDRIFGPREG